jgi:hypothetical protein
MTVRVSPKTAPKSGPSRDKLRAALRGRVTIALIFPPNADEIAEGACARCHGNDEITGFVQLRSAAATITAEVCAKCLSGDRHELISSFAEAIGEAAGGRTLL